MDENKHSGVESPHTLRETAASPASMEEFVRELSHELTNPLMAISALAELALKTDPGLSKESRERLGQILVNCDRIAQILKSRRGDRAGAPGGGE